MDKIQKIIDSLNNIDVDWITDLRAYNGKDGKVLEDNKEKLIIELFKELKIKVISLIEEKNKGGLKELEKELQSLINNEEIVKSILDNVAYNLRPYLSLRPLRKWEKKSIEIAKGRINLIYDNYIERFDTEFIGKYQDYDVDTQNEFEKMLIMLDIMTEYYLVRHFNKNSIVIDFKSESGVDNDIAEEIANQIEKRYNSLRYNYILEKTAQIDSKVMDLSGND